MGEMMDAGADWTWLGESVGGRIAASWMGKGVVPLPSDPSHMLVPVTDEPPVELLQPLKRFHAPSLVDFYTTGHLSSLPSSDLPNPTVDMVYTFVNASSPVLQEAMAQRRLAENLPPKDSGGNRWRDNGELRGALRSGLSSLGSALRKIHVISADFALDAPSASADDAQASEEDIEYEWVDRDTDVFGKWKMGQVPSWVDTTTEQDKLAWHFHSEIYRLPADDGELDPRVKDFWGTEQEWKDVATPTFSSFSIETRLGWIKDMSENM
jgi:3-O-alpha-D-mannopyranosyl-alpha-D-mannopyranose xylosylphosphotransferase